MVDVHEKVVRTGLDKIDTTSSVLYYDTFSHGFGEHLGWYDQLARKLTATGFLVFGKS